MLGRSWELSSKSIASVLRQLYSWGTRCVIGLAAVAALTTASAMAGTVPSYDLRGLNHLRRKEASYCPYPPLRLRFDLDPLGGTTPGWFMHTQAAKQAVARLRNGDIS